MFIDFGVVWIDGEERLTEDGDAVGNARYSPDLLRQKTDDCPAWVDVFSLVQMFQWMISEPDAKHYWQRPTHWRYIDYPIGHSSEFICALRAIGAVASSEFTCPRNGQELCQLLERLFPSPHQIAPSGISLQTSPIRKAIAAGQQKAIEREAIDHEVLVASREVAGLLFNEIRRSLISLEETPVITIALDRNFDEFFDENGNFKSEGSILKFVCTDSGIGSFYVDMNIHAFVPSRWPNGDIPRSISEANVFAFSIERTQGVTPSHRQFPFKEMCIMIERNGQLTFRKRGWIDVEGGITVTDLREAVKKMLHDPEPWEVIAEVNNLQKT